MAQKYINLPQPEILMNSLRSIGYSFNTAIADIIDNSIAALAKHVWIEFPTYNTGDLYLTILDDGFGMDEVSLFNAMKYGSDREEYGSNDLGRFGLGLKSASLSQCRVLTVLSKWNGETHGFRWDLDEVISSKEWCCLKLDDGEMKECPNYLALDNLDTGTLVVWQKFDLADNRTEGDAYLDLSSQLFNDDKCERHICLTFHRFMNRKNSPILFYINNRELKGLDPFLEGTPYHQRNPKVDLRKPVEIAVPYTDKNEPKTAKIVVQACILPHQNDLSDDDIKFLGNMESIKDDQGFYIYRNDRLIIYGTWFKLASKNINSELYKYGRIKVDIPNQLDYLWEIDIKKQNAVMPRKIVNLLRKQVLDVCTVSRGKTEKRARRTSIDGSDEIWLKKESRNGKDLFLVNTESSFIKKCLDSFDDKDKANVLRLLNIVSSTVPFEDIYVSVCNKKQETVYEEDILDSYIILGFELFKHIKEVNQCSNEDAFGRVVNIPPYLGNEELIDKLRRRIFSGGKE